MNDEGLGRFVLGIRQQFLEIMNISYKGDRFIMKADKKKALIVLAALWLAAFILIVVTSESDNIGEDGIVTAFESRDYISTNGTVTAYVNYGNKYLSDNYRQTIIRDIASVLGIDRAVTADIKRGESSDSSSVTATYSLVTENARTDISVITIESNNSGAVLSLEQYILVDISIDNSVDSAVYYKNSIEEYFAQNGIDADITLSLKGSVKGTLSNNKKNEICEDIISSMDGELITGSRSDELYTVYAYSDRISEYVVNGTTKSNINIAITYDGVNDVSWIHVATPILSGVY